MQSDWKLACLQVLPSYACSQTVSEWTVGGTFVSCLTLLWTYCNKTNIMMHGETTYNTTSFQVCYFDSQSLNCNIKNEPISRQLSLGLKYNLVQSVSKMTWVAEGITSSYRATEKAYWRTRFHKYIHLGATATDQGGIRNIKSILFDITYYLM